MVVLIVYYTIFCYLYYYYCYCYCYRYHYCYCCCFYFYFYFYCCCCFFIIIIFIKSESLVSVQAQDPPEYQSDAPPLSYRELVTLVLHTARIRNVKKSGVVNGKERW